MDLGKDLFRKESVDRLRLNGMGHPVHRYGNALLAVTHAESAAKADLSGQSVQRNEILQLFKNLFRPFNVAGASHANRNIDHFFSFLQLYCLKYNTHIILFYTGAVNFFNVNTDFFAVSALFFIGKSDFFIIIIKNKRRSAA